MAYTDRKKPGDIILSTDWNDAVAAISSKVNKAGDIMTGSLTISGNVQLREFGTNNLAYLEAVDANSNRTIGLRIRTQQEGLTRPGRPGTPSITEAVTIDGSGNVGIGTSGPNYPLSFGSNLANTKLAIWDGRANGVAFGLGVQGGQFRLHLNQVSDRFAFLNGADGDEIATFLGTGNVGIGTAAPQDRLQIGTGMAFHDGGHKVIGFGWSPNSNIVLQEGYPAEIRWAPTDGFLELGIDSTSRTSGGSPTITPILALKRGNVGIGTTAPQAKLQVVGSAIVSDLIELHGYSDAARGLAVEITAGQMLKGGPTFRDGGPGASYWQTSIYPSNMIVDLGTKYYGMKYITFGTAWRGDGRYIPRGYHIEVSADKITWAEVARATANTDTTVIHDISNIPPAQSPTQYVKLTVDAPQQGQSSVNISGLQVLVTDGGTLGGGNAWATIPGGHAILATSSNVGIGTTAPKARLSVVASGASEIDGTAQSSTFRTSSGSLGQTLGNELSLASIGFHAANNMSLGIRAHRVQNKSSTLKDWTSAAISLGIDVDNTPNIGTANQHGARLWLFPPDFLGAAPGYRGQIQIGTDTEPADFYVSGRAFKSGGGPGWDSISDVRLKKNVYPLEEALSKLLQLRGVTFEWKEPEKVGGRGGTHIGMVAQEVEQVFPEWVSAMPDGIKLLSICGFEALTVEAFRSLEARVKTLEAKLS
jgi:hypothetical protein